MATGTLTAYDLTVGVIVDMDESIYITSAQDSPMITGVDSDGLSVLGSRPTRQKKVEWMHDSILTPRSTLAATLVTATAFITVASGHQTRFSTGDLLWLQDTNNELLRVTGYGTTADTLTVTRSYGTDAATTHDTSDNVIMVGTALAEGSDPESGRAADRSQYYNLTQIFGPTQVQMSRTEQIVQKYGVSNEFAWQMRKRVAENVISREQAILYGERTESTTTKIRSMGGLAYFITTNVDATSTQITETSINSNQQTLYNAGGMANRLVANPISLSDLNSLNDTNRVRVEFADSRRGRVPVTVVVTEFGDVTIVRNRWCLLSDAWLINRDNVTRRVMTPLQAERLAKTGDSDKMQIVCEESLEVKGEDHMARMSALAYTA
jgi:hypothetical protein